MSVVNLQFPNDTNIKQMKYKDNDAIKELHVKSDRDYIPYEFMINHHAFLNCHTLHTVNIDCKHHVDYFAFKNCTQLKHIKLKKTTFGTGAFSNCAALRTVESDCATIPDECFQFCGAITSVVLPHARTIGRKAFRFCRAMTVMDAPRILRINDEGFAYCDKLKTFKSDKILSISTCAFLNCKSLQTIEINNNAIIHYGAFAQSTNLHTVSLSSQVKIKKSNIPGLYNDCVFQNCVNIRHIHIIGTSWVRVNLENFKHPITITQSMECLNFATHNDVCESVSILNPTHKPPLVYQPMPYITMYPIHQARPSKTPKIVMDGVKEIVAIMGTKRFSKHIITYLASFIAHDDLAAMMRHLAQLQRGMGIT